MLNHQKGIINVYYIYFNFFDSLVFFRILDLNYHYNLNFFNNTNIYNQNGVFSFIFLYTSLK